MILVLSVVVSGFSQTVNGKLIKDLDVDYVEIVGWNKIFSKKVTVEIDFGQVDKFFKSKDTEIRDENDKRVVFNSMIDALNFMSKSGYEFVTAYIVKEGDSSKYHYILRKKNIQ